MADKIKPQYKAIEDEGLRIPMGIYTGVTSINKFGRNRACAADNDETIWGGSFDYVFPTTAAITHIRAATDSAGTQGVVVEVQGLDANWKLVTQEVTTDGDNSTTEVALTTALIRVFRAKVKDTAVMDQDIWLGDSDMSGATDIEAIITAGQGQTEMAIYTVPADHTAYITNYYAHHNPTSGQNFTTCMIELWQQDADNGYFRTLLHGVGIAVDTFMKHDFYPYIKVEAKHDIFITASPVGGAADISAGFDLILVDD